MKGGLIYAALVYVPYIDVGHNKRMLIVFWYPKYHISNKISFYKALGMF